MILGIGDYHDESQNLVGIGADYKRCINVFNGVYNYSVFYQNDKNKNVYETEKIDLKTAEISRRVRIEWKETEILKFFEDARDEVVNNNHDGLIIIISSHGDDEGVILDSDNTEVDLLEIYETFTRDACPHLKDKPKIVFVDACRGRMLCYPAPKENGNENKGYDNKSNNSSNISETQTSEIKTKSPKSSNSGSTASADVSIRITTHNKSDEKNSDSTDTNTTLTESPNSDLTTKTNVVSGNESKSSTNETNENKMEKNAFGNKFEKTKAYHKQGNFRFIYGSIDGYAVVGGGTKGGYLIQALCGVFLNVEKTLKSNLDEIVYRINEQATQRSGASIVVPHIEDLNRMNGPVTFIVKPKKISDLPYVD